MTNRSTSRIRRSGVICKGSIVETAEKKKELECGPMPNVMAALLNIGGALFNAAKFR